MLKNIIYKITYIYNIHLVHDAGLNLVYIYLTSLVLYIYDC